MGNFFDFITFVVLGIIFLILFTFTLIIMLVIGGIIVAIDWVVSRVFSRG